MNIRNRVGILELCYTRYMDFQQIHSSNDIQLHDLPEDTQHFRHKRRSSMDLYTVYSIDRTILSADNPHCTDKLVVNKLIDKMILWINIFYQHISTRWSSRKWFEIYPVHIMYSRCQRILRCNCNRCHDSHWHKQHLVRRDFGPHTGDDKDHPNRFRLKNNLRFACIGLWLCVFLFVLFILNVGEGFFLFKQVRCECEKEKQNNICNRCYLQHNIIYGTWCRVVIFV